MKKDKKINIINGNQFIDICMKRLCTINNVEYTEGLGVQNIVYDNSVNESYQYNIIRSITHDGTLLFEINQVLEIFKELLTCKTIYKPLLEGVNSEDITMINYKIGDLTVEDEYGVKTDRPYPMVRQIFTLPISCELVMRENNEKNK